MNKIIFILLILLLTPNLKAADTLAAESGDVIYLRIPIELSHAVDSKYDLSIELENSESTLLKPHSICKSDSNQIDTKVSRTSYDIYQLDAQNVNLEENKDLFIKCIVLAGADSICNVKVVGKAKSVLDSFNIESNYVIKIKYESVPIIYIRFAKMNALYPSPIYTGENLYCEFVTDRESDIKVHLTAYDGRTYEMDSQVFPKGDNKLMIKLDKNLPAGAYMLRLVTNHGEVSKTFMVIK
jgi:hypothetical protein